MLYNNFERFIYNECQKVFQYWKKLDFGYCFKEQGEDDRTKAKESSASSCAVDHGDVFEKYWIINTTYF